MVAAGLLNSAGFGAVTALLVVYAVQALGLRPTGVQVGVVLAATSAGRIGAGVAFSRIYRPSRVRLLSCVGTLGCALCVAALAGDRSASMAVALLVGYGVSLAVTITTGIVYRQEIAPEQMRSRVMTVGRMIAWGGQPLGAAAAGLIAHAAGVRMAYLAAAGLFCLAAAVASRLPRRCPPVTFATPEPHPNH